MYARQEQKITDVTENGDTQYTMEDNDDKTIKEQEGNIV